MHNSVIEQCTRVTNTNTHINFSSISSAYTHIMSYFYCKVIWFCIWSVDNSIKNCSRRINIWFMYVFPTFDSRANVTSYFCPISFEIVLYINKRLAVPTLLGEKWGARYSLKLGSLSIFCKRRGISYSKGQMWD